MDVDHTKKQNAITNARAYNETISNGFIQLQDPFNAKIPTTDLSNYSNLLSINDDGVMGLVNIPSIHVQLPIYHGTTEQVLEKGIGHLEGTSLPIGGVGTHTVLTGHSGLSNAKLFTDLNQLQEGDYFFLDVWGDTLAYQVDQIRVVLPSDLDLLQITPGKDYCTLLTCTPYGVNTHRLLVRGIRTEIPKKEQPVIMKQTHHEPSRWLVEYKSALLIGLGLFCFGFAVIFGYRSYHKK